MAEQPFEYDPFAPQPARWIEFMDELWEDDPESIDTLAEGMGYVLSGDTSLQKLLMVVGPKRSGKGTIGRVLTGLLGVHNTAAPTLASLTTNFGLAPLIVFGDYLASSSLIGERQRIAEHEAATEEEERRRAELREIREAHPPVAN